MKIIVLDDGIKGNFNQSMGLACAFKNEKTEIFRIYMKGPHYRLPARKGSYPTASKILAFTCLIRAWHLGKKLLQIFIVGKIPKKNADIIISAGSILAPVNLIISKASNAKSVCIMVPALLPLKLFDFLLIPYHDYIRTRKKNLKNLIITLGAPNRINDELMRCGKKAALKKIDIPAGKKVIGIIIGGDDQNYQISVDYIKNLMNELQKTEKDCSIILSTSRRTSGEVVSYLQQHLKNHHSVIYSEFPGYSDDSLYPELLAICDFLAVTEDSINMISESAGCGKPLIILGVKRKNPGKKLLFDLTLEQFVKKGYAEYLPANNLKDFKKRLSEAAGMNFKKLEEANECARKILKALR